MRRTVSRRRRRGLGTGAAVNSSIRRTRMALVAAATERARDGDDDALRLLYLLYADNVFGYVLAIVRDEHDAEDITSEVFARLPRALTHYRVERHPLRGLAACGSPETLRSTTFERSVRCPWPRCMRPARRRSCRRASASTDLRAALAALPDDQRQVMLLRLVAGLTPGEVAERLGRSVDAVHALQHRARRRLREELTQAGWAPPRWPLSAPQKQLDAARDQLRHPSVVREVMDLPLGREARDHQRLLAGVLAQAGRAVAYAQARLLPAAHRQFQRQVVQRRVVDADGAGVDPARDPFALARGPCVKTAAPSPYGESLAWRTASSASATFMTGSVGPKVSSVIAVIEWSTSASTVGS